MVKLSFRSCFNRYQKMNKNADEERSLCPTEDHSSTCRSAGDDSILIPGKSLMKVLVIHSILADEQESSLPWHQAATWCQGTSDSMILEKLFLKGFNPMTLRCCCSSMHPHRLSDKSLRNNCCFLHHQLIITVPYCSLLLVLASLLDY